MDAGRAGDRHAPAAVFAYGTLKQGFRNHAAYCSGFTDVRAGWTWGRLYRLQPGIPILQVPEETVLLMGSTDVASDLEAAGRLPVTSGRSRIGGFAGGRWRRIRGEVLIFPDARERLRTLDAFEGFHPHTGRRQYERTLVPVRVEVGDAIVPGAWAYVLPFDQEPPVERIRGNAWHPGMG